MTMSRVTTLLLFLVVGPASSSATEPMRDEAGLGGAAILANYVATQDADSEIAYIKMTVSEPGVPKREHRFLTVYRKRPDGRRDYLLRMVSPKDVAGVSVLALEDAKGVIEQYFYLPAAGKARRLTGQAKTGALLGSNFTFEDLVREIPSAHSYERLPDTMLRSTPCYMVRATENPGGSSAYAYRELVIAKDTFDLMRVDFFDKNKRKLTKTLTAYDYRSSAVKGATRRPRSAVMQVIGKEQWTDFTVIEGRVGEKLPDDLFTPQRIETWTEPDVEEFIFRFGITVTPE
jgi:hypothetical protein